MLRLLKLFILSFFQTVSARLRSGPLQPSWGFQFEWVIRFLKRDAKDWCTWPYTRLRADFNARKYPNKFSKQVSFQKATLGGVPVVWVTPPQAASRGVLLFFHGGSYIFGSCLSSHAELCARLALGSGYRLLGVEYRLAPEHPYPAALDDATRVFAALQEQGIPNAEIILMGDSAGANLALCLQLRQRDLTAQAKAAVLISPWLDLSASRPSARSQDSVDYGDTGFLLQHARAFASAIPLDDPRVSPLNADLAGLAPVFVQAGTAERLYDESVEFAEKARRAGVQVTLDTAFEMPHNAPMLADFSPVASRALENLIAYVRAELPRK